tara:strand:- start:13889 stop:14626 length:738 start_codon:yes stop_codon:yes gene_type:complete
MYRLFLFFILSFLVLFGCQKTKPKTIILSKAGDNYIQWIEDENIVVLDAYNIDNTDSILNLVDGIILTGGEDINPLLYSDTSNLAVCEKINHRRDSLEQKLFDFAFRQQIPLMGVCRGMQMMNVATGGSLYGDLPTEIGTEVVHRNNGEVLHDIVITDTCSLIFPLGKDTFTVNSWHHQGLKDISACLQVIAKSNDGLAEAIVMDKAFHPFMIAVQFHPERLGNEHPVHIQMKNSFYKAIGHQKK